MAIKSGTYRVFASSSKGRGFSAGPFRPDFGSVPFSPSNLRRKSAGQTISKLRYFLAICCISLGGGSRFADAQPYTQFDLGGTHWTVPSAYVQQKSLPPSSPRSVTLQFELPKFTPVNPQDFAGVTPGDALPILSIKLTDDPGVQSGQALLDSLMSKVQKNCAWCVADSSLGGKRYSNYALNGPQLNHLNTPAPFALYVNPEPQGNWFAICYFSPNLSPLPCQRTIKIGPAVTVTLKFPREYISQAFSLETQVLALMAAFQLPVAEQMRSEAQVKALPSRNCWVPTPGSPDAETLLVHVGPELWHIPAGYAEPFGVNQTNNSAVNSFVIFLKLPDLAPLDSNDPSPFLIHGQGQYIGITVSFQPEALLQHPKMEVGPDGYLVPPKWWGETYLGKDPFLKYNEFDSIGRRPILPELDGRRLVAENKAAGFNEFPPAEFDCGMFSPDENAGCEFRANKSLIQRNEQEPEAGYVIDYSFSREYYSQITTISDCVRTLFQTLSDQHSEQ